MEEKEEFLQFNRSLRRKKKSIFFILYFKIFHKFYLLQTIFCLQKFVLKKIVSKI